ncbi:hypothetical protein JXA32_09805 [Candidatus Sumerlaeota bacterium]|nr:hypothetical protein [Candidatus Sumerlaeota bacterium]
MDRMIKYCFQILGLVLISVVLIAAMFMLRGVVRKAQFNNEAGAVAEIMSRNDIYAARTRELIDNHIVEKYGQNPPDIQVYRHGDDWLVVHQKTGLCRYSREPGAQPFDAWRQRNEFEYWDIIYSCGR